MEISVLNTWSWVGLVIDFLLVIWLLSSLISGAKNGFVYSLAGLLSVGAAVVGAWLLSGLLVEPVTALFQKDQGQIIQGISNDATRGIVRVALGLVIGLLILILIRIFGKGISGAINDLPMVGGLNQILGAVLNVAVTAALVFAILLAWQRFFPAAYGDVMKGAPLARFAGEHNLLTQLFR